MVEIGSQVQEVFTKGLNPGLLFCFRFGFLLRLCFDNFLDFVVQRSRTPTPNAVNRFLEVVEEKDQRGQSTA